MTSSSEMRKAANMLQEYAQLLQAYNKLSFIFCPEADTRKKEARKSAAQLRYWARQLEGG